MTALMSHVAMIQYTHRPLNSASRRSWSLRWLVFQVASLHSKLSSAAQPASFLSMMGCYVKVLPQYSTTTATLCQLHKNEPWVWSQACTDTVPSVQLSSGTL
ncbi:hypothetical protein MHYP_G00293810 [Metynnis hypsauchen]